MPCRRRWRHRYGTDRGGGPVETAIIFPAVVLLLVGAVQVATYFLARGVAATAAQAAVSTERSLNAQPGDGKDDAEAFLNQAAGDWLTNAQVSDPVYTADGVTYTVSGTAITLVPGMTWQVQQSAHGTREQFTP